MYEFIFAEDHNQQDLAPTIFTFDAAELLRSYDWPKGEKSNVRPMQSAAELAYAFCKQFGRRVGYREQGATNQFWFLTDPPKTKSRKRLPTSKLDRTPSDEIYELKLARGNDLAFADLPVIGTMDIGAYKRYGYDDGPAQGLTAKSCAVTLLEVFERAIAYRKAGSNDAWLISSEDAYFVPFDNETTRAIAGTANSSGLYRLHSLQSK